MRKLSTSAAVAALAAAGLAATASTAAAGPPTGIYADFAQCPTNVPNLATCVLSDTTGGEIKLGNQAVPITKRIRLQGGYTVDPVTYENTFYGAKNGETLEKTALDVPGGLLGITIPPSVPQPIRGYLQHAIDTANGVKATAELVGPVKFSFGNFANAEGSAVELPVRVKLQNSFLGNNCYIGSAAAPVTFKLTTGTTAPPSPAQPLSGATGTADFLDDANLITLTGASLVDNAYAAPKASGCGGAFAWAIDPVVNLKIGLPSAAGKNSAVFNGDAKIAAATAVVASGN